MGKSGRSRPSSGRRKPRTGSAKPRRRRNFNAKTTSKFKGGSSRRWRGQRRRKTLPSSTPATCRTSAGLSATCPTTSYPRRSSEGKGHRQGQVRHPRLRPTPQKLPRERPSWIAEKRKKRRRVAGGYLRVF